MTAKAILTEQKRLQVRFHFKQGAWLACLFTVGLAFSSLGLMAAARLGQDGVALSAARRGLLWFGLVYFGSGLLFAFLGQLWLRPRIVPCFARQIEEYGGKSSAAFRRGRGLYREIVALDALAEAVGARPLSSLGFADDYYGQQVQWHAASEGVRTAEALRQALQGPLRAAPDVAADLDALSSVLREAAGRGVAFSLRLRLHKDSLQVVSSMEARQGRFW